MLDCLVGRFLPLLKNQLRMYVPEPRPVEPTTFDHLRDNHHHDDTYYY